LPDICPNSSARFRRPSFPLTHYPQQGEGTALGGCLLKERYRVHELANLRSRVVRRDVAVLVS